jgi:hypothetical protein
MRLLSNPIGATPCGLTNGVTAVGSGKSGLERLLSVTPGVKPRRRGSHFLLQF